MSVFIIEEKIKKLVSTKDYKNFIFDFLLTFNQPKTTISRLKNGDYNLSKKPNEIVWKKKIYFYRTDVKEDVHDYIDTIIKEDLIKKNSIRFIIVTDFNDFLAVDTKSNDTLDIKFSEIPSYINFFLPLTGIESFKSTEESPADRKAATYIGKLYDQIIFDNKNLLRSDLNLFFSRLLFLYYADDANIFEKDLFLKTLKVTTDESGDDLDVFLTTLFEVLNSPEKTNFSSYFQKFPYVGGYLFQDKIQLPKFTKRTREIIINNALMDWQSINPDILGSMLQSVVSPEEREEDEMHYTSVPNILNVIGPLFLDDLQDQIVSSKENEDKLKKILNSIYRLKIFDPACGSGNFLIIAYKQLCLLEIQIFQYLRDLNPQHLVLSTSGISLNQFFGIEKSHFASETSKLSLWLAEHQMKIQFQNLFGEIKPSLPIKNLSNIICDNSININWVKFCELTKNTNFIYLIGNPPFKGFGSRSPDQQKDMIKIFGSSTKADYVSLWFLKGAEYLSQYPKNSSLAFVSTNSTNQGEQVEIVWKKIFKYGVSILFANKSFIWRNNAANNAGVTVSIIGLGSIHNTKKILISKNEKKYVNNINPYLLPGNNLFIDKRSNPISFKEQMVLGDMAKDGEGLVLSDFEYRELINNYPEVKKYFKRFFGGIDFLRGVKRWCLWCDQSDYNKLKLIEPINKMFEIVRINRLKSKKQATKNFSKHPYRFVEIRKQFREAIIVPTTTSERRHFLPIGFVDRDTIITAPNQVIYGGTLSTFAILSSKMHALWLKTVGGRLTDRLRYSSQIVYNTFPFEISDENTYQKLEDLALNLLDTREKYSDLTISELYDPDKTPLPIIECHNKIDEVLEKNYKSAPFLSDEERIEYLFKFYEKLTNDNMLL